MTLLEKLKAVTLLEKLKAERAKHEPGWIDYDMGAVGPYADKSRCRRCGGKVLCDAARALDCAIAAVAIFTEQTTRHDPIRGKDDCPCNEAKRALAAMSAAWEPKA